MRAAVDLPVANGGLGRQFQDPRRRDGRDEHLQAAETGLPRLRPPQTKILAADRRAPAPLIHDRLETKTGKAVGQLAQATLDMLGEFQAGLRVQPLQLLLGQSPLGFLLRSGSALTSAPFDRVRVVPENPWRNWLRLSYCPSPVGGACGSGEGSPWTGGADEAGSGAGGSCGRRAEVRIDDTDVDRRSGLRRRWGRRGIRRRRGRLLALIPFWSRSFCFWTGGFCSSVLAPKNCIRSPKVRIGSLPFFMASVSGISGLGWGLNSRGWP